MKFLKQILFKLNTQTLWYVIMQVFFIFVLISYPHNAFAIMYQPGQTLNPTCLPTATNCGVVPPLVLSQSTSTVTATAPAFVATSSSPSTFPYASTTAISVSGGTASTSALTLGTLTGIMRSVNGVVETALVNLTSDITGVLSVIHGGTGIATVPTYGKVLLGNSSGTYDLVATSSLGISSSGGGTPGGSSNQIQVNSNGTFGASPSLTFNSNTLSVQGTASSTNLTVANSANVKGALTAASAAVSATTTTQGLSATFAHLITSTITNLTSSIAKLASATITNLTGTNATLYTASVGALTATSSLSAGSTTLGNTTVTGSNTLTVGTGLTSLGGNATIAGTLNVTGATTLNNLAMNSTRITDLAAPIGINDAANKAYVDAIAQGISWQPPVIALATTTAPTTPATGDRYVILSGATNFGSCTLNQIAQYSGSTWVCSTPSTGWSVYVNQVATNYNFNGTSWVSLGSTINHDNLFGLQGGQTGQYYHLNLADYNNVHNAKSQLASLLTTGAPSFVGLTITGSSTRADSLNVVGITTIIGDASVSATTTTSGLASAYASITKLVSSIAKLASATITNLTGTNATFYTANVGALTATSSLAVSGNTTLTNAAVTGKTTLTNASSTNQTVSGYLNVAGKTTLGNASTTQLSVSGLSWLTGTTTASIINVTNSLTLAPTTPSSTSNALYNKAGTLYWNGSAVGGVGISGTEGQTITMNSSGSQVATSTLFIASAGNVGIGDTTPGAKLSVAGRIEQTGLGFSTFIGAGAGANDDLSSNYNTAVGYQALLANTTGYSNTAVGYKSLYSNTAMQNTANGYESLYSNTTGANNTATGYNSLYSNIDGNYNTALGFYALYTATTSDSNTAVGYSSLRSNTTGAQNTATGFNSLYSNTTGTYNTATGYNSLRSNTTGTYNIAIGDNALYSNNTAHYNIAIGHNSLYFNTSVGNTAVGYSSLTSNTTGHYDTAIGYNANVSANGLTNATVIGSNTTVNASNKVRIGNASVTVIEGQVGWSYPSDRRLKKNINDSTLGLDFIDKLNPVTYNLKKGNQNILYTGLIAQDVEKALDGTEFSGVVKPQNKDDFYSLRYSTFVAPLINAVQEQQSMLNPLYKGIVIDSTLASSSLAFMNVGENGNIGIGTSTPYSRLTIWGSDTSSTTAAFTIANSASTTEFQVNDNGNAFLAGSLSQNSDKRLKTKIEPLSATSSLAKITGLIPVNFNWKDSSKSSVTQLGFIAQDVQQIFPNIVSTTSATVLTPNGTLSLNYIGLISPIVSSIKELAVQIAWFAQSITTKVITATTGRFTNLSTKNISTKKLCIGNTCVNEAQLKALLKKSDQSATASVVQIGSGSGSSNNSNGSNKNKNNTKIASNSNDIGTSITASSTPKIATSTTPAIIIGCTDSTATNYKKDATKDNKDNSKCTYPNTPPIITLSTTSTTITVGGTFDLLSFATANDREDGNITSDIKASSTVSTSTPGTYKVVYNVSDSQGLSSATKILTVIVKPKPVTPIIKNQTTATSSTSKVATPTTATTTPSS